MKSSLEQDLKMNSMSAGSGKPVVMVHGSYGSLQDFKMSIFDRVSERYRAVAVDMPGHGLSGRSKPVMTLEEHAEALHAFFADSGIEKPLLVGHSWGGAVTLAYAVKYPKEVSGIVFLGAYVVPYERLEMIYRVTTTPVLGDLFVRLLVRPITRLTDPTVFIKKTFYPNEVSEAYAKTAVALATEPESFKFNAQDVKLNLGPDLATLQPRYSQIRVPVSIVTGDTDSVAPAERHAYPLHRMITQSKLIVLPGTGHHPAFSQPDEVVRVIDMTWDDAEVGR
jgi:pimeloyl-ACP methyl ester carboxylesterase